MYIVSTNTKISQDVEQILSQEEMPLPGASPAVSPDVTEGQFAFSEHPYYGLVGSSIIATHKLSTQKQQELESLYNADIPQGDNWVRIKRITRSQQLLRQVRGKGARVLLASLGYASEATPETIAGCFKDSVAHYSNSSLVYERLTDSDKYKKGELVAFPMRSRWNFRDREWYSKRFYSIKRAIKPHREVTMLTLTYAPDKLKLCMQAEGWLGDIYGYAVSRVWTDVKRFKDRLYRWQERELWAKHKARRATHYAGCYARGEMSRGEIRDALKFERARFKITLKARLWWKHLATVLEFQDNGIVHVHLVFKDKWLAPINREVSERLLADSRVFTPGNLVDMWSMSEPQGVDIKSSSQFQTRFRPERYISSYLKKALSAVKGEYVNLPYAYTYYFSTRMYNVAHNAHSLDKQAEAEAKEQAWLAIGTSNCLADNFDGQTFSLFGRYRGFDSIKNDLWYTEHDDLPAPAGNVSQLNDAS